MRLLMIHADRFAFEVTGETSVAGFADELAPGEGRARVDDVLVAFLSVEQQDESGARDVAEQAAAQVRVTAEKVGAGRVVVYPYAHLSSDLAKPRVAAETAGKPGRPANTPRLLSRCPVFVG